MYNLVEVKTFKSLSNHRWVSPSLPGIKCKTHSTIISRETFNGNNVAVEQPRIRVIPFVFRIIYRNIRTVPRLMFTHTYVCYTQMKMQRNTENK